MFLCPFDYGLGEPANFLGVAVGQPQELVFLPGFHAGSLQMSENSLGVDRGLQIQIIRSLGDACTVGYGKGLRGSNCIR